MEKVVEIREMPAWEKRERALENNHGLYETIFASHGLHWRKTPASWYSLDQAPKYYSNLVTRSEEWRPDDIFQSIDQKYEGERWPEWSIKDSFATLDLIGHGFERLFDAEWLYVDATKSKPMPTSTGVRYERATTKEMLAGWRKAWDTDERLGERVFYDSLLDDPSLHFVVGYKGAEVVVGCLFNKTGDVLGISNTFFSDNNATACWSELMTFAHSTVERCDIVGYERSPLMKQLIADIGAESVGPLTVWLKQR